MSGAKNDLRVRMTKRMLRQELTDLLVSRPVQKLTVSELCEKAGVNRSTFYAHYADIYDLLEKIEAEMYAEFQAALSEVVLMPGDSADQAPVFMYAVFDFIKRNSDMCTILLGEHSDRRFVSKLLEGAKNKSIEEYKKAYPNASRQSIEVFYTFAASGCLGLLEFWLENGMKESAQQMASIASRLITTGVAFLE